MSEPKFKVGDKIICTSEDFSNLCRVFIVYSVEEREVDDQPRYGVYTIQLHTTDGSDPTYYNSEQYYTFPTPLEELL